MRGYIRRNLPPRNFIAEEDERDSINAAIISNNKIKSEKIPGKNTTAQNNTAIEEVDDSTNKPAA